MSGQHLRFMALLFILVPTIAILFSLFWALENDELAGRRELGRLARGYLLTLRQHLKSEMDKGAADAAVLLDEKGRVLFPRLIPYRGKIVKKGDDGPTARGRAIYERAVALKGTGEAIPLFEEFLETKEFANITTVEGFHILSLLCCQALEWLPASDERRKTFATTLARLLNDWNSPIPAIQQMTLTRKMKKLAPKMKIPARNGLALALAYVRRNPPRPAVPNELQRTGQGKVWHKISKNRRRIELFHETSIRGRLREALRELGAKGFIVELVTPGEERKRQGQLMGSMNLLPPLSGWSMEVLSSSGMTNRRYRWLLIWGALLVIILGVLSTVSIAKALERHLSVATMKNSLVTNVSHELRTPIAAMQVLIETLDDRRIEDPEQTKEYVTLLGDELKRLSRLVENFLSYSRMESGFSSYKAEPIEIEEVVEEAVLAMGHRFDEGECSLDVFIAEDLPSLKGDRDALVVALVNLLDNGYKYGRQGKEISLKVETEENDLSIRVTDMGPGIPKEESRKIFERFYRVDDKATSASGSGLGLAIVEHIIRGHGGTITVDEPPGATFTIRIPT